MPKKFNLRKGLFMFAVCLAVSAKVLGTSLTLRCFAETSGPVTDFAGLQDAIRNNTGDSIEIANNIDFTAAITVDKSLTFKAAQGAGSVRLTAPGSRHFNVSGGDISLTFDGNVIIDGGNSAGGINSTAASLTLNNAIIQNCVVAMNGGGVFSSRSVTVNNCVFIANSGGTGGGGAIWSSADLTAHDSSFSRNTAFVGAGVYSIGNAGIYNSVFTVNTASGAEAGGTGSSGGGAVYSRGSVVVDNCTISGNKAGNGGGVCSYGSTANDTITVRNGTKIIGNQSLNPGSGCGGGAIYSTNSRVIIEDGELADNTSVTGGGAIYSDGGLTVTGGVIRGNTSGTSGGAARVFNALMSVSGGEISGNISGTSGGAIMTGYNSASVSGTAKITGNISNGSGVYDGAGGISLYYCTLNVSGGEISGNTAAHANGGGIGDYWGSSVNVTGGSITGNHAPEGNGGGIYVTDLTKVTAASEALFSGNTASRAFWMTDPADIALHNANIHTTSRSAPPAGSKAFTYLFNNYDVNYTKGDTQNLLPIFSVTVTSDGNGTAESDKRAAYQGETVTLTATPHSGYKFKGWIVTSGNVAAISGDGTFIMPDSDVVIRAIFEPVTASGGLTTDDRIASNRTNNYVNDNYATIGETPPPLASIPIEDTPTPLAGLPPQINPNTGNQSSLFYVILGISSVVLGIFVKLFSRKRIGKL